MLIMLTSCIASANMVSMDDNELSDTSGQALFAINKQTIGLFTYYRMSLDTSLDLNMNIASMQLGRTSTGTDISATNVSFGCVADAANNCITSGSATARSILKPFTLTRPYMEFAIKNDGSAVTREVSGIRLGAENVTGPFSIGTLNSFSGYLSGTTQITMYGTCNDQQGNRFCSGGIPATPKCGSGSPAYVCGSASAWIGEPDGLLPNTNMGLVDASATLLGIGAWLHELAVGFPDATVKDAGGNAVIPVAATGQRVKYAYINNVNFAGAISGLVGGITVQRTTSGLGTGLINLLLPILASGVTNTISGQIQNGMNPANPGSVNLNSLTIPYNLKNIHQLDINSANFGLSFQKEALTYPGYTDASGAAVNMQAGWSMYAKNAFNLLIQQPTWNFTNGITSGAARNGNIVALPGPYVNCWGTSAFC
ncbi:MAG: hypothetical protein PSX71_13465 [bacterium]|nr:hypothetical protein [bacterium]